MRKYSGDNLTELSYHLIKFLLIGREYLNYNDFMSLSEDQKVFIINLMEDIEKNEGLPIEKFTYSLSSKYIFKIDEISSGNILKNLPINKYESLNLLESVRNIDIPIS